MKWIFKYEFVNVKSGGVYWKTGLEFENKSRDIVFVNLQAQKAIEVKKFILTICNIYM